MIHVAVLLKPYLDLILSGRKTVECRLTRQAREPYECIEPGERIYFKLSAGPFAATAIAEHVMFEDALTPRRVNQIKRDYNEFICGAPAYWSAKRQSQYCCLIWLKDVQPSDSGPAIRPLQGVAWLALAEEPAWRRLAGIRCIGTGAPQPSTAVDRDRFNPHAAGGSFVIEVTEGNVRNNTLYVSRVIDRFPAWARGGRSKADAARPITLILHEGPTVHTDIVGPRNMLRTRVWGRWFREHGAKRGDRVVFTPVDEATYWVGLSQAEHRRK